MSKKKARQPKKALAGRKPKHGRRKLIVGLCLLLILSVAGGIFARWRAVRIARRNAMMAAQPVPSPGSPSKEYIYAGGRLVATEEPNNQGTSPGPTNLSATVGSVATQVSLTWTAPSAPVDHYRIERAEAAGNFSTSFDSPVTSFTDSTASNKAYLYRVCGVDAYNNRTAYSNVDLATTVIFTDDPLVAGSPTQPGTTIKAEHLVQLRQAVNAVRTLAGLGGAAWTYPDPVSEPASQRRPVYGADVLELRAGLDQALSQLALPVNAYTNQNLSTAPSVGAIHFQELRNRVK